MRSYSITRYRKLLLELGFRDRATADLANLAQDFSTPRRRALAARELAFLGLAAGGHWTIKPRLITLSWP